MSLRFPIKVNKVNNLSDARYCAGMGVAIIGISNEISIEESTAITGWITGIDICIDLYSQNNISEFIDQNHITYVETADLGHIKILKEKGLKVILRLENKSIDECTAICEEHQGHISLFNIFTDDLNSPQLKVLSERFEIIISNNSFDTQQIGFICDQINPQFVGISGGDEISPGLRSFDEMAEILEYLELND